MWHIKNPNKVFSYLPIAKDAELSVNALLLEEKYNAFPVEDRLALENIKNNDFSINTIKIQSPNNPAQLLNAKLISFQVVS